MKKSILFILLFILSIGSTSVLAATIYKEHNDVTFEETVLYGDSSVTEGLNILRKSRYLEHSYWDTSVNFEKIIETDTSYSFYPRTQTYEFPESYDGLEMQTSFITGNYSSDYLKGLSLAYREALNSLEPGVTKEFTVYLKDYVDYYDFDVYYDFPNYFTWGMNTANMENPARYEYYEDPQMDDNWALRNYFKIPVLDDATHTFTIEKNADNTLRLHSYSYNYNHYEISPSCALSDDVCYFIINTKSDNGDTVDTSLLPDGYGIFAFPYGPYGRGSKEALEIDKLTVVYPLDPNTKLVRLDINDDQTHLHLYAWENNQLWLSVIEIASMKEVQKQVIYECGDNYRPAFSYDNGLLIVDDYQNDTISLFTETEDHLFEFQFSCSSGQEHIGQRYIATFNADYNGEYLVFGDTNPRSDGNNHGWSDFYLRVYNKDGLQYYGKYENSLDSGIHNDNWDYPVRADHHDAFEISWK